MRTSVKLIFAVFFAAAGFLAAAGASHAMPTAPANHEKGAVNLLQDVRWGCRVGWTPNRWGRCVPIRRYYYAPRYPYGPRYYYGPRYRYYGPRYRYYHRW